MSKKDQNSVFVSEAVHGEIIILNNQIFEEGYMSHPKYLGSTVWFNIQLVPKSKICYIVLQIQLNLCDLFLSCHNEPKYTLKVKVIKYFLQIFVIWNIWSWKKWGARYTFWYIVLLTLYNGDRRIVHWTWSNPQFILGLALLHKVNAKEPLWTKLWWVDKTKDISINMFV